MTCIFHVSQLIRHRLWWKHSKYQNIVTRSFSYFCVEESKSSFRTIWTFRVRLTADLSCLAMQGQSSGCTLSFMSLWRCRKMTSTNISQGNPFGQRRQTTPIDARPSSSAVKGRSIVIVSRTRVASQPELGRHTQKYEYCISPRNAARYQRQLTPSHRR